MMLSVGNGIHAQTELHAYMDIGTNNVSEGCFIKNGIRGSYRYEKYQLEAGMQFDLKSMNPNILTGLDIMGSREFLIKDFSFDIKGFFMMNRFSDLMYETNWGAVWETRKSDHFMFALGTNFKTYAINSSAGETFDIPEDDRKLRENFNLIYTVTAYLKPHDHHWNVGLSCTNIDYYTINQSTNPVFNIRLTYSLKSNLTLYLDTWYKQAGMFNLSANHFGYFFRGGIRWEI